MKRERANSILFQSIGVMLIILMWLLASFFINNDFILPTLGTTLNTLVEILSSENFYISFAFTFLRTIISIVCALILGVLIGLLAGLFPKMYYLLNPLVSILRFIPAPCFIFLLFSLFVKMPDWAAILLSFLIIFPILYESVAKGVMNIDQSIKMSLKLEGYYKFNSIFKVIFPQTFPFLAVGIINSLGLGIKSSIMSEIIIGSSNLKGIGRLIYVYNSDGNFPALFALIIVIIFVFLIIDALSSSLLKKIKK